MVNKMRQNGLSIHVHKAWIIMNTSQNKKSWTQIDDIEFSLVLYRMCTLQGFLTYVQVMLWIDVCSPLYYTHLQVSQKEEKAKSWEFHGQVSSMPQDMECQLVYNITAVNV